MSTKQTKQPIKCNKVVKMSDSAISQIAGINSFRNSKGLLTDKGHENKSVEEIKDIIYRSLLYEDHDSLLLKAIEVENIPLVKYLLSVLDKHNIIDRSNPHGYNAFTCALETSNKELIELLFPYVNERLLDEYGNNILMIAIDKSSPIDIIRRLLPFANIDHVSDSGLTAVYKAVKNYRIDVVDLLIENGCDVFIKYHDDDTLLISAAVEGFDKIVNRIIGHVEKNDIIDSDGINSSTKYINSTNNYGNTALHKAVQYDYDKCAELLINAGADIDIVNKKGETPMMLAIDNDNAELIELMLKKYKNRIAAAIDYARGNNSTFMTDFIESLVLPVEILVVPVCNPVVPAAPSITSLTSQLRNWVLDLNVDMISSTCASGLDWSDKKGLLQNLAMVTENDNNRKKIAEIAKMLIGRCDVNHKDGIGCTPLMNALRFNNYILAEMLIINHDTCLKHMDHGGNTASYYAGNREDLKQLIETMIKIKTASGNKVV